MELIKYYVIEKKPYKKVSYIGLKINGWKQYRHFYLDARYLYNYLDDKLHGLKLVLCYKNIDVMKMERYENGKCIVLYRENPWLDIEIYVYSCRTSYIWYCDGTLCLIKKYLQCCMGFIEIFNCDICD